MLHRQLAAAKKPLHAQFDTRLAPPPRSSGEPLSGFGFTPASFGFPIEAGKAFSCEMGCLEMHPGLSGLPSQ